MKVLTPRRLDEALEMKAERPDAVWAAGTTDLLPRWNGGAPRPAMVVSLASIGDLAGIEARGDRIRIGALATHADIASHLVVRERLACLADAARSVGAPAIRNMGTLGGNLANASPAADLPPALLALDAEVHLASRRGERGVPVSGFFVSYGRVDLEPDELIVAVSACLPRPRAVTWFRKLGTRRAQSIAKLSVAGHAEAGDLLAHVRLAAGAVAPVPLRLRRTEEIVEGRTPGPETRALAAGTAEREVTPIDDVRSSAGYRRAMVGVLVARFLESLDAGRE